MQIRTEAQLTAVELRIRKESYKVLAVARRDVVTLQMQRDVAEDDGIAIDVEGPDRCACLITPLPCRLELAQEVLGKVRRCYIMLAGVCARACALVAQGLERLFALPSEDREAPDSLNSSLPIWMGNTRSWGRI
jgi:hypothetical protein